MQKNTAGQKIGAQMVSASDGSAFTGSVTVSVTGDAGTQATGSVSSGACTHEGNGYHTYAPAQAETNYTLIAFTFTGTGAVPATVQVFTEGFDITAAQIPANVTQFGGSNGTFSGGRPEVNTTHLAGTSQTARDIGASVLLSSGSGTGQLDFTSGVVKANLAQILGTALTETAGQIAAGFKKFFNIATPAATMDHGVLVDTVTTLTNAPSDSSGVTTLLSRLSALRAGYLDNLSAGAVALEASLQGLITTIGASAAGVATAVWGAATRILTAGTNIVLAKGTGITGFNDLSAAQVNAEADTALSDYGALKPTTAGRTLDVSATGEAGVDWANVGSPTTTVGLTGTTIATSQVVASVSGAVGSVTGNVGGNVTGSVGSVVGAVGSVTGNVGGNVTGSVGSVVGAVGSVTGNVGGNVTGSIGSLATQAKADVNTEVVDALTVDVVADSVPADGSRPTIAQALYILTQFMLERSVSGTSVTVKKPDGSTTLLTLTLDDATTPTSVTRSA